MIWSDGKIMENGPSMIEPFDPFMVQPTSIDLTLDKEFLIERWTYSSADPSLSNDDRFEKFTTSPNTAFTLMPGRFALASTFERVTLPDDVAARYEGKSSLGRLGLFTHVTAGFIDPGFSGNITLELFNALQVPIHLWPGMKIGQLCFMSVDGKVFQQYGTADAGSHYQSQRGPTPSRSHFNFLIKNVY